MSIEAGSTCSVLGHIALDDNEYERERETLTFEASVVGMHTNAPKIKANIERRDLVRRADDLTRFYPERNLSVPVDFFPNDKRYEPHSTAKFNLRYWFDATYYKPGGPVFVLLGGETDGEGRLPFLQKGIVHQVIKATNGIGVILEHRYYGKSFPVSDLRTKNLRFLSTEQALAEIDYFAKNVKFEGIKADLTAPKTPWIVYGGSYAGAQSAFMRVKYPDTFWGAISSSGVTEAIYDYWQYFEPIRTYGPPDCIKSTQLLIDVVDKILLKPENKGKVQALKDVFGMGSVTDNRDFANQLTGVYGWQSTNWDPKVGSSSFFNYCGNLTNETPQGENLRPKVADLAKAAGYDSNRHVQDILLNAITWLNNTALADFRDSSKAQNDFFTTLNATALRKESLADYDYVSWNYQVCTEWGFIQTGNTPSNIMPLISRTLDLEYLTYFCKAQFNITKAPDLEQVNKYGGYKIDHPRLAIIGGNADPWRPATPLWYPDHKQTSTSEPWLMISHGVHHWEENGIFDNETTAYLPPAQVVYAQQFLKNFVVDWLAGESSYPRI